MKNMLGRGTEVFRLRQAVFEDVYWTFEHTNLKLQGNAFSHRSPEVATYNWESSGCRSEFQP